MPLLFSKTKYLLFARPQLSSNRILVISVNFTKTLIEKINASTSKCYCKMSKQRIRSSLDHFTTSLLHQNSSNFFLQFCKQLSLLNDSVNNNQFQAILRCTTVVLYSPWLNVSDSCSSYLIANYNWSGVVVVTSDRLLTRDTGWPCILIGSLI